MCRKSDIKFTILSMICLWVLIVFLSSAVIRLFYAIVRTFIYLVGLVSVLLSIGVTVAIVLYVIYRIISGINCYKRGILNRKELYSSIIRIQFKIIFTLVFIYFILGITYVLIT